MRLASAPARIVLAAAVLAGLGTPAFAEEATAVTPAVVGAVEPAPALDAIDAWAASLGTPASARSLERLPALPRSLCSADAARAVAALGNAGGFEAADALRPFLEHRSASVRIAAARAVGAIGIRVRATVAELRDLATAREPEVRLAAYDALGRVGDARDVPGLLARLGAEETEVRAPALRSLRSITGVRLVGSVPRWERWWRLSSDALPRRLYEAIAAVTLGASEDVAAARATVVRYAWADMDAVEDATRGWLQSSDVRLRAEGARVTTALRLGGLADDVRSVLRYSSDPVLFAIAAEAAQAVGAPFDDIRKPVATRQ
jgi:hypothetical protein